MNTRKARLEDVPTIQALINSYAEQGAMLPRSLSLIYENLRDFQVVEEEGQLIGVGALHILWDDLAELRAVAVKPPLGRGVGRFLIESLLAEAREIGFHRVFALTNQPGFFEKVGFQVISKEQLPHKVWKECINCAKFPNCDEVALIREV